MCTQVYTPPQKVHLPQGMSNTCRYIPFTGCVPRYIHPHRMYTCHRVCPTLVGMIPFTGCVSRYIHPHRMYTWHRVCPTLVGIYPLQDVYRYTHPHRTYTYHRVCPTFVGMIPGIYYLWCDLFSVSPLWFWALHIIFWKLVKCHILAKSGWNGSRPN